jgi:hypothetical protein
MNRTAGTEKPRSVSGGSWPPSTRQSSCSRETLERVQFDITTARSWVRWKHEQWCCCGCGRDQSTECRCGRKKKKMGRQSPKSAPDACF